MFNSSKQVQSLRKLLTSHSSIENRQTVFASASIPQHNRFLHDCVQQKWTKVSAFLFLVVEVFLNTISTVRFSHYDCVSITNLINPSSLFHCLAQSNVMHIHVNPVEPMPSHVHHKFMVSHCHNDYLFCSKLFYLFFFLFISWFFICFSCSKYFSIATS